MPRSFAPVKIPIKTGAKSNGGSVSLPPGELATLTACIQFPEGLRREQLTVLTQYKRSSRDAYIQRLREKGLVESAGDMVKATDKGRCRAARRSTAANERRACGALAGKASGRRTQDPAGLDRGLPADRAA